MKSSVWALFSIALLIVLITFGQWGGARRFHGSYADVLIEDGNRVERITTQISHFLGPKGARYEYDDQHNRVVTAKIDVAYIQTQVDHFERDNQRLPKSLQELTPDYMEEVPAWFYYDPQNGRVTDRPYSEQ